MNNIIFISDYPRSDTTNTSHYLSSQYDEIFSPLISQIINKIKFFKKLI